MVCIHCGNNTRVVNSRSQRRLNQVWRRRQCQQCGAIFTTEETALRAAAWTVRGTSGVLHPFSRDKLFLSLYKSLEHRHNAVEAAGALTDTVTSKLASQTNNGALASSLIAKTAQVALNRFDKAGSVHYAAFHAAA